MRWVFRIIGWLFAGVLGLALVVGLWSGWVTWRFQTSTPQIDGEIAVAGPSGTVRILRDERGIPHIFGDADADVYFGLGYAHAQDRLFQMDLIRRSIQGRLAEAVPSFIGGDAVVRLDARARTRGDHLIARTMARNLSPETRAAAEAYGAGVNAFIAGPKSKRSPEFAVLMLDVAPWTVEDTTAVAVYMLNDLAGGLANDLDPLRLADALTPQQIDEFLQGFPDFGATILGDALAADASASALPAGSRPGVEERPAPGSNSWVVSGARTASGAPLLANDPHLGLGAPSVWYLARLALSDGDLVGATIAGAPLVLLGRSDSTAWGNTNGQMDVLDLVPSTEAGVRDARAEIVKVRFGREREIVVRTTNLGPVLDPAWFNLSGLDPETNWVLRSPANDADVDLPDAAYRIMRARSFEAFRAAGSGWVAPIQNMIYADAGGTIGFAAPGRTPVRDADGVWRGPGADDVIPWVRNPATGLIATANNLQVPLDHPAAMPGDYAVYRARRLIERLEATRLHDAESFAAIQTDVVSDHVRRLLPALRRARPETDLGAATLTLLDDWNGEMDADAPEPLVMAAWMEQLAPALYADELGEMFPRFNYSRRVFTDRVLNGALSHWCDDVATEGRETCGQMTGRALDAAAAKLLDRYGPDPSAWRWGEAHPARFDHPLLAGLPILGDLTSTAVAKGGDGSTLNVAHFNFGDVDYATRHAAGFRAIYDLSDLNESLFAMAPGQAGHPLSPHYRDLALDWADGRYFQIRTDWDEESPPPGFSVLTLTPE